MPGAPTLRNALRDKDMMVVYPVELRNSGGFTPKELAYRRHEAQRLRLVFKKQVIPAFQSEKTRIGDAARELQPPRVRDTTIVTAVNDECGHTHQAKPLSNIHSTQSLLKADCVLRRSGHAHQFVHPPNLFRSSLRNESEGKHLAECRIILTPSAKD